MKYMGIDYGSKRVGIALSNDEGTMAFPNGVLSNDQMLFDTLEKLIEEEGVGKVIVGHSLNLGGKPNVIQKQIDDFIAELTLRINLPIEVCDERYTSKEAERIQGKTDKIDASAAAIILNSYLSKK